MNLAFYTLEDYSFDILYKGVEIVSGSIRKYKYQDYIQAMEDRGIDPGKFTEYLEIFKQAPLITGGYAIGLERLVKQYLNLSNVKEATI